MTQQDCLDALMETYHLVRVMADKNGCRVLLLRHKDLGRDIVVRQLPYPVAAYATLCDLLCENLPQVYDVIDTDDGQTVLEEYVDGVTVAEWAECGRIRYTQAVKILRGVCHALSVLHRHGYVHRDVKPENVLVRPNGQAVLVDLNISRKVSDAGRDTVIMGTVGYASPEQLGLTQSDARTDIYACGVLLNVMLTGKHPSEQLARGRAGRIVRRCTAVNPDDRYQTANKLARAL
ncbi:MAG: serine/threonine protein kinase [Clostridia bacterium]|nr:serine/threonine protein kinase [Clostridia bacterium]